MGGAAPGGVSARHLPERGTRRPRQRHRHRNIGSGNPGASNVTRALGWRKGVWVFVLDALKGAIAAGLGLPSTAARLITHWARRPSSVMCSRSSVESAAARVSQRVVASWPCCTRRHGHPDGRVDRRLTPDHKASTALDRRHCPAPHWCHRTGAPGREVAATIGLCCSVTAATSATSSG